MSMIRRAGPTTRVFERIRLILFLAALILYDHRSSGGYGIVFATAFEFKLSSLLGYFYADDEQDVYVRPVFPRRDLVKELGKEGYERLVSKALNNDAPVEERDEKTCAANEEEEEEGGHNQQQQCTNPNNNYGVDASFPTHYLPSKGVAEASMKSKTLTQYDEFLEGCEGYHYTQGHLCRESELDRIDRNLNQPSVMQNYTTFGFQKTRAPEELFAQLKDFWESNQNMKTKETWGAGDTHTNHWSSPSYMLNVEDAKLYGGGVVRLKNAIWEAAQSILEEWISTPDTDSSSSNAVQWTLSPTSLYGIRVYSEGSILAPHVDRLPLVTSAIINVAQDVQEPWPLEIYGHDGKAYNVTLEPGDMLLYESHSVIHGRPFPLKGQYYANIFIHFEPKGHCVRHAARMNGETVEETYNSNEETEVQQQQQEQKDDRINSKREPSAKELYEHAKKKSAPDIDNLDILPFHIVGQNSMTIKRWTQELKYQEFSNKKMEQIAPNGKTASANGAHTAASFGDYATLKEFGDINPHWLDAPDENGWRPLHESSRGGHLQCVKYLLSKGVEVNARTNNEKGATPLWWAENRHGPDHPVSKFLREKGAISISPDY